MVNKQKVDNMLLELGFPEHLQGTQMLRLAVSEYRPGMAIVKELYPAIAAACNSTPSRTERAIRHAIESVWRHGSAMEQYKYFGSSVDPERGKPVNGHLIARLAYLANED